MFILKSKSIYCIRKIPRIFECIYGVIEINKNILLHVLEKEYISKNKKKIKIM